MALQVPEAKVEGDSLTVFPSSGFAERGFCRTCGSHIFHRPIDGPELAISAGLFDDPDQSVAREIFVDNQPRHYRFEGVEIRRTSASMAREWLPKIVKRRVLRWFGRF